jgi:hypothetical protein
MITVAANVSAIELAKSVIQNATSKAQLAKLFAQLAIKLKTTSDIHNQTSQIPRVPQLAAPSPDHDAHLNEIFKSASRPPSSIAWTVKAPLSMANATYGETPPVTIRTLLRELAAKHNNSSGTFTGRFIDAGSGNGSATVSAALDGRFPRCSGIEYDERRSSLAMTLKTAYDNSQHKHDASSTLDFTCGDLATENLSGASVVFSNSVVWDANLCATMGRRLEEAALSPDALVVSISRRFPCPSFDLVDILKMPCNGGDDFSFYVCQKHAAHIVALSDSETMKGLRGVCGMLESLISLATTQAGSNESLAFLAAVATSESSTRILTAYGDGIVLEMLSDRIGLSTNALSIRASSSMVLRAISDHPVGRRRIAENDTLVGALLENASPKLRSATSEHPTVIANVLDIIGQLLNDSMANEKLGLLNIDDHLEQIHVNANAQDLGEVRQACEEAQSMRRWWAGEQRNLDKWIY